MKDNRKVEYFERIHFKDRWIMTTLDKKQKTVLFNQNDLLRTLGYAESSIRNLSYIWRKNLNIGKQYGKKFYPLGEQTTYSLLTIDDMLIIAEHKKRKREQILDILGLTYKMLKSDVYYQAFDMKMKKKIAKRLKLALKPTSRNGQNEIMVKD